MDALGPGTRNKLIGMGTDGATVMAGCKTGVVQRLRDTLERQHLVGFHCAGHRLELAIKDSACKLKPSKISQTSCKALPVLKQLCQSNKSQTLLRIDGCEGPDAPPSWRDPMGRTPSEIAECGPPDAKVHCQAFAKGKERVTHCVKKISKASYKMAFANVRVIGNKMYGPFFIA